MASAGDTPDALMASSEPAMPSAMARRWLAMPMPVCSMASASAFAATTVLMRSASARAVAACWSRWAELMAFMERSTSDGSLMLVIKVLTTSKP